MTFPATPLDISVQLYYSAGWHDITSYVYSRDRITIRRGRSSFGSQAEPGTCTLTLNNRDGRFSPRNPSGPLYGLIGRNTPIKVQFDGSTRFVGEVYEWPVRWGDGGSDVYVTLTAAGLLRRLGQGASPLQSPLRRAIASATDVVAYWPCEDGQLATSGASGVANGSPLKVTRPGVDFGSNSSAYGSDPVMSLDGGTLRGKVPYYTPGLGSVRFLCAFPDAGSIASATMIMSATATGTGRRWEVQYEPGGSLSLHVFNSSDTERFDTGPVGFDVDGRIGMVGFDMDQDGANVTWSLAVQFQDDEVIYWTYGTFAAVTLGSISSITVAPSGGLSGVGIGHILVQNYLPDLTVYSTAVRGHQGEYVDTRFNRLCYESNVTPDVYYELDIRLGVQGKGTLLDLLNSVEAVDGMMWEHRMAQWLTFASTASLANQTPTALLSYETHIVAPLDPTEDDQMTRNKVTVTRELGASATVEDSTSSLGTARIGTYDDASTLSLHRDAQASHYAGWKVHIGTWDDVRYDQIRVSMARSYADRVDIKDLDIGRVIQLDDMPSWMPPGPVRALIIGYEETVTQFEWDITYYCVPADIWDAWELEDDTFGLIDTSGSYLFEDLTTGETDVTVVNTGAGWSLTTPYDIAMGGETMTVTAVNVPGALQVLTVTRSVNGVVKTHAPGEEVHLSRPPALLPS